MILKILLSLVVASLTSSRFAHAHLECHTEEPDPDTALVVAEVVRRYQTKLARDRRSLQKAPAFRTVIPTVYHIVEGTGNETLVPITDELIQAQNEVLNEGFAGSGFSFELAGITRTEIDLSTSFVPGFWPVFTEEEEQIRASLHQGDFDTLNVYIVPLPQNFGGYASLPSILLLDGPEQDGVVINNIVLPGGSSIFDDYVGNILTHEVGHWLDLYHTFQGGCDAQFGDFVSDTPKQLLTQGCPAGPIDTCPNDPGDDPTTNFMGYSNDSCLSEFTPLQIVRMQATWEYFRTGSKAPVCTKLCNLMIPDFFPNLGQCKKAMCNKGNVKGDSCDKATRIKLGKTYTGSTVFAEVDDAPTCNGITPSSGGVWYTVQGNGGLLRASTCSFTSLLMDSQVSVYEGGCGSLSCVTANNDSPTCTDSRGEAIFIAKPGTEYHILVHGFRVAEGPYELVVDEIPRGSCFAPTSLPGCEDLECEASVCASNPFCCDVGFSYECVLAACDACAFPDSTTPLFCEECSDTLSDLEINIATDAFPSEITWEVAIVSKDGVVAAGGGPYQDRFFLYNETVSDLCPSDCFEFRIFDAFGDGICCSSGEGTYSIAFDGETISSPTGGVYGAGETISFGNCL